MNKIRVFSERHPILFAILAMLLAAYASEIPLQNLLGSSLDHQTAFYLAVVFLQGAIGLALFWLIRRFGWLSLSGFTHPREWRAFWLGWPLLVFTLINGWDFFADN